MNPHPTLLKVSHHDERYYFTLPYPRRAPGDIETTIEDVAYVNLPNYRDFLTPPQRPFHVLLITVNGYPAFTHGGKKINIRRGGVSFYGHGEEYRIDSRHWEAFTFHFHPSTRMATLLEESGVRGSYSWNDVVGDETINALQEIFAYPDLDADVSHYRAVILLEQVLLALLRHLSGRVPQPKNMRMEDVHRYIQLHPTHSHSIESLAQMVGLSPSRLAHLFKEEFGVPVYAFIIQERMRRARVLLETTAATAAEVGAQVGYADPRHFYSVFKKAAGISAGAWREQAARKKKRSRDADSGAWRHL